LKLIDIIKNQYLINLYTQTIIPSIVTGTINGIVISALALDVIICKKPAVPLHLV